MLVATQNIVKKIFNACGLEIRKKRPGTGEPRKIWIDVGAHLGETTLGFARSNPDILVFAFEPNWSLSRQIMGQVANFLVFPMAVSEKDGLADFFLNAADYTSSLLPFDPGGLNQWRGSEDLRLESRMVVPTIRLDTFMH